MSGWPSPIARASSALAETPHTAVRSAGSATAKRDRAEAERLDQALYAAVALTSTPLLDGGLARLSDTANCSRLWLCLAAGLAVAGGRAGRRAGSRGLASSGLTSIVVNLAMKQFGERARPKPPQGSAAARRVRMPGSSSFPSGHAAVAFAFATGVGAEMPLVGAPVRLLAALVAYSRVHTGVHYPGDVLAGSILGTVLAQLTTRAFNRGRGQLR